MRDVGGADHRAGARAIFNHDRLPQPLADTGSRDPRYQIIGAARPKAHDETDRMIGPLRARSRRGDGANQNASGEYNGLFYHCFLLR